MKILFITSNRVGDAVLSTGLLDHLIRTNPDCAVTVVCGPAAAGVFAKMPNRARTIAVEKRPRGAHWIDVWRAVVGTRWDLVVDLRASALSYLVRTRRRVLMRRLPGRRETPKATQLGVVMGIAPPLPVAWFDAADVAAADRLLPRDVPLVALGPTANWHGKVWPPERFVALFEALPGSRAVVLAGPGEAERAMAAPVLAALPDAIDLVGALKLPQAAAVLARCTLFVGNDSGLMHLAASVGCRTLGLFGPTPHLEYAPSGPRAAAAVSTDGTMAGLSVAAAVAAAKRLLA